MSMPAVGLESALLLINLISILIFVILKKRLILTILVPIAILQHLLLNWNNVFSLIMYIFIKVGIL